jgi:hypothetical protein
MRPKAKMLVAGVACLSVILPVPAHAQWWKNLLPDMFDLSTAWGLDQRTVDAGIGWELFNGTGGALAILAGAAAVETGLQQPYCWTEDKTVVVECGTDVRVDPRAARSTPKVRKWARAEFQRPGFGGAIMWDPRGHFAFGVFGSLALTRRSEAILELRSVKGLGVASGRFSHDLSVRLRWR